MLNRHEFVRIALSSIAERGTLSAADIEETVEEMLVLVPHLRGIKQQIVDDVLTAVVTSVGPAEVLVDDEKVDRWLETADRSNWIHWPWLQRYLADVETRPLAVLRELDDSSDEVIDLLGDPCRDAPWDRRGLVVGHVQSGKTEHYTAVACKAIDAGYKVVIILSGIHENLRQQTQERVESVIIGKDSRNGFSHFGIRQWSAQRLRVHVPDDPQRPLPDISTLTSMAGDYGAAINSTTNVAAGHAPIVLVVKKNVSILRNLLNWVAGSSAKGALLAPALIIDDEADHSSVNTNAADEETNPTRINELIRKILWRCDRVAFVGYTATPYANIFADAASVEKTLNRTLDGLGPDLFPKSFIVSLKPPTNYIGAEEVFGRDADDDVGIGAVLPLPMHRLAADAEHWLPARHRKTHVVSPNLPESLREALRAFLLAIAARHALGNRGEHMSMLVHVSRFTDVQEQITRQLEVELASFVEGLRHSENSAEGWVELERIWTKVFAADFSAFREHPSQQLIKPHLPTWDEVRQHVLHAYSRIVFRTINSGSKSNLDYTGTKEGLIVVAVGGDRLSRGLTLSGLLISYFQRGARAFDTLMQMGRWFGYRPGYAHLCRIYAPRGVVTSFKTIALATEELRREFSRMAYLRKRPTEYGLRVREPRADLLVTAMNKMRRGETVKVRFAESLVSSLVIPHDSTDSNRSALADLVSAMNGQEVPTQDYKRSVAGEQVSGRHARWENVPAQLVLDFLQAYRAVVNVALDSSYAGGNLVSRYVASMMAKGELSHWTVAMFGTPGTVAALSGEIYGSVHRNIDEEATSSHAESWVFRGIALGRDEALDLSSSELEQANQAIAQVGSRSKAACYRAARPAERGLLLVYPIRIDGPENKIVVGVAVSFPESRKDQGLEYVCNPRSLRELFGDELVEDNARDLAEERDESPVESRAL